MENIPIVIEDSELRREVAEKTDQILTAKKADATADTSAMEKEIDQLVYALYGLTEEEIKIVEES